MTQDTKPKSWRDLPPEPPVGDVPPAPPRPAAPDPPSPAELAQDSAPPPRHRRWAVLWVPLLVLALLAAVVGGVWAFVRDDREAPVVSGEPGEFGRDDAPTVPFDSDPPSDFEELFPPDYLDRFGRNFFDEFGPELDIPDELLEQFPRFFFEEFGRDFFGEGGPGFGSRFDEEFGDLLPRDLPDDLDELRRFFDDFDPETFPEGFGELFESLPPELRDQLPGDMPERFGDLFDRFDPDSGPAFGGVSPTYVPADFRVSTASVRADEADFQVEITMTGPGGPIEVAVLGGSVGDTAFRTADGDPVEVAGAAGLESVADGTRRITYRKDDVTVIITAPEDFARSELLRVAEGLELTR